MTKAERIKKRIKRLEDEIVILKGKLHDIFAEEAIREVNSWRPDLRLMLGSPPNRLK